MLAVGPKEALAARQLFAMQFKRRLYLAGYSAIQFQHFAEFFWLHANRDDLLPARLQDDLDRITSALREVQAADLTPIVSQEARNLLAVFKRVWATFSRQWQGGEHQRLIEERSNGEGDDDLYAAWELHNSLIRGEQWESLRGRLRSFTESLPADLRAPFEAGLLVGQVLELPSNRSQQDQQFGPRFPIRSLEQALDQLRQVVAPVGDSWDVDLSDAIDRALGQPYVEAAREKVFRLHREIARDLSAAVGESGNRRSVSEDLINHSPAVEPNSTAASGQPHTGEQVAMPSPVGQSADQDPLCTVGPTGQQNRQLLSRRSTPQMWAIFCAQGLMQSTRSRPQWGHNGGCNSSASPTSWGRIIASSTSYRTCSSGDRSPWSAARRSR